MQIDIFNTSGEGVSTNILVKLVVRATGEKVACTVRRIPTSGSNKWDNHPLSWEGAEDIDTSSGPSITQAGRFSANLRSSVEISTVELGDISYPVQSSRTSTFPIDTISLTI